MSCPDSEHFIVTKYPCTVGCIKDGVGYEILINEFC